MGPTDGPLVEWQRASTDDGEMAVLIAQVVPEPRATVLVLQEAFGVNAHIQSVAARFAAAGYRALAPDLFHRSDTPLVDYADREEAMRRIERLGVEEIATDVGGAASFARELSGDLPVIVCGFCFGARAAFTAACAVPGVEAAICFYGPGTAAGPHAVLDLVKDDGPPMLLFFGAEDPTIPADQIAAIGRRLDAARVRFTSRTYEDAGHAFACDARPAMYRPEAALDAWMRSLRFIDELVESRKVTAHV
jgi:carboxymethylenebutenolidase